MIRALFAAACVFALAAPSFGQCQNGQCVRPGYAGLSQFGLPVPTTGFNPAAGRVEVRNVTGRGLTRVLVGENGKPDVFFDDAAPAPAPVFIPQFGLYAPAAPSCASGSCPRR